MFKFKLKLFLQKTFFRLIMLGALLCFLGVFVFAILLEKNNKPPSDAELSFTKTSGKPVLQGEKDMTGSLAIQNKSGREVGMELAEMAAEALTFNKDTYAKGVAGVKKYFTDEGYAQYQAFLTNVTFENTLVSQNLQSGAFTETEPLELTHGVYNDVYKWVFEVPITLSFIPRGAETYRNDETTAQNRRFILRAQIARIKNPTDPDAVAIELWQVLPPRPQK